MTFAEHVVDFYRSLTFDAVLPDGIAAMNPYVNAEVMDAVRKYYAKFYSDNAPRLFVIGINPGRFGAGVTGIPFTDTLRLDGCGIEHHLNRTVELSSEYIYKVADAMGGADVFFSRVYLTSLSPIGFTKDGKNYNYYDSASLQKAVYPFIKRELTRQIEFGANREAAFSLGAGKNFKRLSEVNEQLGRPFKRIIPINHPRFVMQYRRKRLDEEIAQFVSAINSIG